ncbi:MAG: dihydropteroate synthase [Flavobacteriaceae bacterium]|nr:dihydropteroate synthase [Flavobacteriaceae bacterium]MCO4854034.1 dihydropteroate synthase [Flavobacteriaceae bacterium]
MAKNTNSGPKVPFSLNCKGNLIFLDSPKIMGVLNITPDSFYDGGRYKEEKAVLDQVDKMCTQGATFIDIGAYSSRPGAAEVSEAEEQKRLYPILQAILKRFPDALLSIDTFRSGIAKAAVEIGAAMINDISAGQLDPEMIPTVGKLGVPYVMMHMRSTPKDMQEHTHYDHFLQEILSYFSQKIDSAKKHQITDIIIDPGYGFAKTTQQNFELLRESQLLNTFGVPVLTGLSRKSMIYKTLNATAEEALNGTTALHMQALLNGSSLLRVHDVAAAKECILLYEALQKA